MNNYFGKQGGMKHSDLKCNISSRFGIMCQRGVDVSGLLLNTYLFNQ